MDATYFLMEMGGCYLDEAVDRKYKIFFEFSLLFKWSMNPAVIKLGLEWHIEPIPKRNVTMTVSVNMR